MYYDQQGISRHYNASTPMRHGSTSSDHSDSGRRRYSGRTDALGTSSFVTGSSYGSVPGSSSYIGRSHTVDYTPTNGSLPRYGARSHDMERSGILRRAHTADSSSHDYTKPHYTHSRLTDLDPKRTTSSRWGQKDGSSISDMTHRGSDASISSQTSIHATDHGSTWRSRQSDHPRSSRWPESKTDSYHHHEAPSSGYSSMSRSGSSKEQTADSSGAAPWRVTRSKTFDEHDVQSSSRRSSQDSIKSEERDNSLRRRRKLREEKIAEGEAKEPESKTDESTDYKRRSRPYLSRAKTIDVPCPTPKEKTEGAPERPWRARLDKSESTITDFLDKKYGVKKTAVNGEDTKHDPSEASKVVAARMEAPEVKHSVIIGETREERIARYKEQRRKELAEKYGVTDKSEPYQVSGKSSFKTPNLTAYTRTSPRETKIESKKKKVPTATLR